MKIKSLLLGATLLAFAGGCHEIVPIEAVKISDGIFSDARKYAIRKMKRKRLPKTAISCVKNEKPEIYGDVIGETGGFTKDNYGEYYFEWPLPAEVKRYSSIKVRLYSRLLRDPFRFENAQIIRAKIVKRENDKE